MSILVLEAAHRERSEHEQAVLAAVKERCRVLTVREFAAAAGVDPANLSHVLSARRRPSRAMLAKLGKAVVSGTGVGDGSAQGADRARERSR